MQLRARKPRPRDLSELNAALPPQYAAVFEEAKHPVVMHFNSAHIARALSATHSGTHLQPIVLDQMVCRVTFDRKLLADTIVVADLITGNHQKWAVAEKQFFKFFKTANNELLAIHRAGVELWTFQRAANTQKMSHAIRTISLPQELLDQLRVNQDLYAPREQRLSFQISDDGPALGVLYRDQIFYSINLCDGTHQCFKFKDPDMDALIASDLVSFNAGEIVLQRESSQHRCFTLDPQTQTAATTSEPFYTRKTESRDSQTSYSLQRVGAAALRFVTISNHLCRDMITNVYVSSESKSDEYKEAFRGVGTQLLMFPFQACSATLNGLTFLSHNGNAWQAQEIPLPHDAQVAQIPYGDRAILRWVPNQTDEMTLCVFPYSPALALQVKQQKEFASTALSVFLPAGVVRIAHAYMDAPPPDKPWQLLTQLPCTLFQQPVVMTQPPVLLVEGQKDALQKSGPSA